jgi:hypothetical protein
MGFYTKGNYLYLPNKRVVDDLIERDGVPNKESFTPYNGMNYLITEQMKGSRFNVLGIDVIKENIKELHVTRLKGKEDSSTDEGSQSMGGEDGYETLLENIEEGYVTSYLRNQLIGLKINKTDARHVVEENEKVQALMYDTESGEVFNLSDVYVKDEYEDSSSMLSEVRNKIPYLLKKLQDGSIHYGVSLLSLFIARDGVIQKTGRRDGVIKPRELLAYPIYRVSGTGDLLDTFDSETANNIPKFRAPKDLVLGASPNDPYYKAGVELTIRARQLGYDLFNEDVRDYTPSYINRLMCSYILSNQEVLSDMAMYDPNIMQLFRDGSIFKAPSVSDKDSQINTSNVLKLRDMARQKLNSVPELHNMCDNDKTFHKPREPVKLINQFLKLYKEVNKKSTMEVESTYDCILDNDTLCDSYGQPLIFKGDAFVLGFGDTPLFSAVYFIVTSRGYAIKIDDNPSSLMFTTVNHMIVYKETQNRDSFFKKVVYL